VQIVLEDGDASVIALGGDSLEDHGGGGHGVDLKKSVDLFFEGVQFTGPLDGRFLGVGVFEVLSHGFSVDMKGGGNLFL